MTTSLFIHTFNQNKYSAYMIITTKIKYAINALVYLAENHGTVISAREISEKLNIPKEFISKILQSLVSEGFVCSKKGKNGGFVILANLSDITVKSIYVALGYTQIEKVCWLGLQGNCIDKICDLCTLWEKMSIEFEVSIKRVNLQILAESKFVNN
ncbi:MAG: Rrf2 family transcriptional regulator [Ignavibacteriae bacterium HGW-Ignavibacteriae-2]|nr:MAG: Rrf2 family transcriptional regulator [Ignavibacteriae bacterium HGW-Ignavibacteriae-2]